MALEPPRQIREHFSDLVNQREIQFCQLSNSDLWDILCKTRDIRDCSLSTHPVAVQRNLMRLSDTPVPGCRQPAYLQLTCAWIQPTIKPCVVQYKLQFVRTDSEKWQKTTIPIGQTVITAAPSVMIIWLRAIMLMIRLQREVEANDRWDGQ